MLGRGGRVTQQTRRMNRPPAFVSPDRPAWDIGRPQPAFESLARLGAIEGRVLDVGCGTGDMAIYLAERGHQVVGIDTSAQAIGSARIKAARSASTAWFAVHDALELGDLEGCFDTVVDSGCLHLFDDEDRGRYLAGLQRVLRIGGSLHVLACSQHEAGWVGVHAMRRSELRGLSPALVCERIEAATFDQNARPASARAWLASFVHVGLRPARA